jgi:hypothetical protein
MAGVGETAISTMMQPGSGMNFFGTTFTTKATGQFAALYAVETETLAAGPQVSPESRTGNSDASQSPSGTRSSGVTGKMQPTNTKNSPSSLTNLQLVTPQTTMPTPVQLIGEPIAASLSAQTEDADPFPAIKSTTDWSSGAEFTPTFATNTVPAKTASVPGPTSNTFPTGASGNVFVVQPSIAPVDSSGADGTASPPDPLSTKAMIASVQSAPSTAGLQPLTQIDTDLPAHDTTTVDQKSSTSKNPVSAVNAPASARSAPQSQNFDVPPPQSAATATKVSDSGSTSSTDPAASISFMQVTGETASNTGSDQEPQAPYIVTNAVTENALSPQNAGTPLDPSVSSERNATNLANQNHSNEPSRPGVVSQTISQAGIPRSVTPNEIAGQDTALAKAIQQGVAPQVEVLSQNSPRDAQPIDDSQTAGSTQAANEVPASEIHVQSGSADSPDDLPLSADNNEKPTSQPSSTVSHSATDAAENLLASIRTLLATGTAQGVAQSLPNSPPTTTGVSDMSSSVLSDRLSFAGLAEPTIVNSIQLDSGASGVNSVSKNEIHRATSTYNPTSNPAGQAQTSSAGQAPQSSKADADAVGDLPTASPQKSITTVSPNSAQAVGASHAIANAQTDPATSPAGTTSGPTQSVPSSVSSSVPSNGTSKTDAGHTNAPSETSSNLPVSEPQPAPAADAVQMAQMVNRAAQSEMRIGLNTSAFGSVEVRATVHANDIGVSIGSEKGDLRSLISNDLPNIANTLQQQNLRLNQVNFHQGFAFSNQMSSGGDAQQGWSASRTPSSSISVEEAASENPDIPEVTSARPTAGLSILA